MQFVREIGSIVKKYKFYFVLNGVFNILGIVFSVFSISLIVPLIEVVFKGQATNIPTEDTLAHKVIFNYLMQLIGIVAGIFGDASNKFHMLIALVVVTLIGVFLRNFCRYMSAFIMAVVRNGIVYDLRDKLYRKVLYLPPQFFVSERKGDIIVRFVNDPQEVEWGILHTFEIMLREPLNIIMMLAVLLYISWEMTLGVILIVPLALMLLSIPSRILRQNTATAQFLMDNLTSTLEEILSGIKVIIATNTRGYFYERFKRIHSKFLNKMITVFRIRDMASPMSEFLGITIVLIIILWGGYLVINNKLTFSLFMAYSALLTQLIPATKNMLSSYMYIQKGYMSLKRILTTLAIKEEISQRPTVLFPPNPSCIIYDNVSVRFGNRTILKDISVEIKKGEITCIVGQTGSGKTTMVELLMRFCEPSHGTILIDDIPIHRINLVDLRNNIGYVPQYPIIFNDTIYNNITLGRSCDPSFLDYILDILHLREVIEQKEKHNQIMVGEMGGMLSGGEKQRIAIARALATNPKILILDEHTANIDPHTEEIINEAIRQLAENKIIIMVAHKISAIKYATRVIVLANGEIVDILQPHQVEKYLKTVLERR